jgi:hypothetical protein
MPAYRRFSVNYKIPGQIMQNMIVTTTVANAAMGIVKSMSPKAMIGYITEVK